MSVLRMPSEELDATWVARWVRHLSLGEPWRASGIAAGAAIAKKVADLVVTGLAAGEGRAS